MSSFFYKNAFIFCVILVLTSAQTKPEVTLKLLNPKGFQLSIPNEDGIGAVAFHVNIDSDVELDTPSNFSVVLTEPTNNAWVYDNPNTRVNVGNVIHYWFKIWYENRNRIKDIGTAVVSETTETISNECQAKIKCDPSITTVGGKTACKGQLIFEDTFDKANWTKWSREVRMPLASDDGQFVMFLDRNENCNVKNGQLHIVPSLSTAVLGNDNARTRKREFSLGTRCTAIQDKAQECRRKAQFYQILPPIISARINTKNSFSFRYGTVEIRAKLPKGDWLFPLLLLEPLESFYGTKNYASGQIRIAFSRGNEILQHSNSTDLSNKVVYSGAVLSNFEKDHDDFLYRITSDLDMSAEFHNYFFTWKEDGFSFQVDSGKKISLNEDFSRWLEVFHGIGRSKTKMAPFDREFYLTLGVSAGGHADFPDNCFNGRSRKSKPWRNGDPKAQLHFWEDTLSWLPTWKGVDSGLHVDYVKVYAL